MCEINLDARLHEYSAGLIGVFLHEHVTNPSRDGLTRMYSMSQGRGSSVIYESQGRFMNTYLFICVLYFMKWGESSKTTWFCFCFVIYFEFKFESSPPEFKSDACYDRKSICWNAISSINSINKYVNNWLLYFQRMFDRDETHFYLKIVLLFSKMSLFDFWKKISCLQVQTAGKCKWPISV